MSEITLALEHPSLGCGEVIARYDLSEIQEKAYLQGRADAITECLQIVQKIKDDYNDARFGEQIPINYGTLCGIIIAFEQMQEEGARYE